MNRIMIIRCCGAGKSTLARKLHQKTDLPLIHLDQHFHLPDWQEPSREDWIGINQELLKSDHWIMDGNYGSTIDMRLSTADTVIFMDYPTVKCYWRVIKRIWKYHGQVRPDMPEGCRERLDIDFLHYVATFGIRKRPGLMKKIEAFNGKKVFIRSDKETAEFLEML